MLPVRLFIERSITWSNGISPMVSGISAERRLFERERKITQGIDELIFWGIWPWKLLFDRSSNSTGETGRGIFPVKKLELKSASAKGAICSWVGNWPFNWLRETFNNDRLEEISQTNLECNHLKHQETEAPFLRLKPRRKRRA